MKHKQAVVVKQTILIWQKVYALPSHLTLLKCIQYEQCYRNVLNWICLCSPMWCANISIIHSKSVLSHLCKVCTLTEEMKKSWQSLLKSPFSDGFQSEQVQCLLKKWLKAQAHPLIQTIKPREPRVIDSSSMVLLLD